MKILMITVIISTFIVSSSLATEVKIPPKAKEIIAKLHPTAVIDNADTGDLDNDGIEDLVYVVFWEDSYEHIIGVLQGQTDGAFVPWSQSKIFNPFQRHPEVLIKRGSFFISLFRNSLDYRWSPEVQFKLRNGHFVKIGEEYDEDEGWADESPRPKKSIHSSTNYLTREKIELVKFGKKTTTKKSKIPDQRLQLFENFHGFYEGFQQRGGTLE